VEAGGDASSFSRSYSWGWSRGGEQVGAVEVEEMKKKNTEHGAAHNSHGGQGETGCFLMTLIIGCAIGC